MTRKDLTLAVLLPLLWGFNFIVMKYAVTEASPLFLVTIRFLLATFPLIFFVPKPDAPLASLALFAFAFAVVKFCLLFTAFRMGAPAGVTAVVLQMQAIVTVALSLVMYRERPGARDLAGLALAGAGLAVILYGLPDAGALDPLLFVFAAATAWSCANLVIKSLKRANPTSFVVWTSALATLMLVPLLLVLEGPGVIATTLTSLSAWGWASILYLAYPVSIGTGIIWSRLLTRYPSVKVTPFALAAPAIALLASSLIFGEDLTPTILVGSAAIVLGVAVNTLSRQAVAAPTKVAAGVEAGR